MDDKKRKFLEHYPDPADRDMVNNFFEMAEKVSENNIKKETGFLDPYKLQVIEKVANNFQDVDVLIHGGFEEGERKKAVIAPSAWNLSKEMAGVDILSIKGNFDFTPISHRDVLGAILGLGLKREMIGDIIVETEGDNQNIVNVAVDEKISEYIIQNLKMIKRSTVRVEIIDEQELALGDDYVKEINSTVASLRLDSVASVGFKASRNKMKELIKGERVKINHKPVLDPKNEVNEDDVISLRGKGRIHLVSVGKISKKGRRHIVIRRYK